MLLQRRPEGMEWALFELHLLGLLTQRWSYPSLVLASLIEVYLWKAFRCLEQQEIKLWVVQLPGIQEGVHAQPISIAVEPGSVISIGMFAST